MQLQCVNNMPVFSDEPVDTRTRLWWLGQAGFAIAAGGKRIIIDPYLSDSLAHKYRGKRFAHIRMMPPPVQPRSLTGVDLILCTHAHTDHMDPDTLGPLIAINPSMRVIVPRSACDTAVQRGVPFARLIPVDAGECIVIGCVSIHAIPAAHEQLRINEKGEHLFLGYVLHLPGSRIYHSGDCVPYPQLAENVRRHRPDIALLPVNGRDAFRQNNSVPGNFTAAEALSLCQETSIRTLIAQHFGMFNFNTVNVDELAATFAQSGPVHAIIPQINAMYVADIRPDTELLEASV